MSEFQLADIVQIKPEYSDTFGGCLAVVHEVHDWGVSAYVAIPGKGDNGGLAYVRIPEEHCVHTGGSAPYVTGSEFSGMGNVVASTSIANDTGKRYTDD